MRTLFGCQKSRLLIAGLSALVLMLSASLAASANPVTPSEISGISVPAPQSLPTHDARDPLHLDVRYWGCADCREYCYVTWRINCGFTPYCRRSFVLCMRDCWYRFCR